MRSEDADDIELELLTGESLSDTDSYLEVETQNASQLWIYVDNGSSRTKPNEYNLVIETRKERSVEDWMFDRAFTGETTRSYSVAAPSNKARIDITNVSASTGNYRVYVESIVEY